VANVDKTHAIPFYVYPVVPCVKEADSLGFVKN